VGWIKAVDGVDLDIATGKTLGLVGESGCGKSTLARLILRLIDMDEGKLIFEGKAIHTLSDKEFKPIRKKIQIIFQDPFGSLNPKMTIGETIEEGLRVLGIRAEERKKRVKELLEMVGIPASSTDMYPHEFSGGQRQRIGIARALSVNPSLIICDEPVSALDVSVQAQIINLLRRLQEELAIAYLFISHDINLIGYMSDMIAVMYLGKIVEIATSEELFENPKHPYTRLLLSTVPEPDPKKKIFFKIKRQIDVIEMVESGCKFWKRCPYASSECREVEVPMKKISSDHWVRCINL
jgi:oligopeptide/dipeptide ABC transporter ATP-binding protein